MARPRTKRKYTRKKKEPVSNVLPPGPLSVTSSYTYRHPDNPNTEVTVAPPALPEVTTYPPPPMPKEKPYEIVIRSVDHGYMVHVGCQTFAIETQTKLLQNLAKYLKDPGKIREAWMSRKMKI